MCLSGYNILYYYQPTIIYYAFLLFGIKTKGAPHRSMSVLILKLIAELGFNYRKQGTPRRSAGRRWNRRYGRCSPR